MLHSTTFTWSWAWRWSGAEISAIYCLSKPSIPSDCLSVIPVA
ncbi:hypothetical protein OU5_P0359 (plasmid) [Pseudomonas mandelii JR-1]|uniref:Uncharacterized protein n=1 Tax=Pseudomonas mandelii JR-1 TaxID=1147786 RepID=A0A024ELX9_9PSED|nr:hypothetical protein OU5_P0359 [Pseudomonas mandelii JR-1]